jgi:hypothetical protein
MSIKSWRSTKRRARARLVVAMILQVQHLPFQLRTSSTKHAAQEYFADSDKGMHFSSCNFCLKKCLDEPAQFKTMLRFEIAHQPVRTNTWLSFNTRNLGVMEGLLGLQRVSFRSGIPMFRQGTATSLK